MNARPPAHGVFWGSCLTEQSRTRRRPPGSREHQKETAADTIREDCRFSTRVSSVAKKSEPDHAGERKGSGLAPPRQPAIA